MDPAGFLWSMGTSPAPIIAAFFIGIMAAINPCTLATNITATAFIANSAVNRRHTFFSGCMYTLGRIVAYVAVASAIVLFGINVQFIALALQHYGGLLIGPFLVLCGIYLLLPPDLVRWRGSDLLSAFTARASIDLAKKGYLGAFLIGIIFALSFCPFSAVLFFGMLVTLSLAESDPVVIPAIFALATGLPVIIVSCAIAGGVGRFSTMLDKLGKAERAIRYVVAAIFIAAGGYLIAAVYAGFA